MLKEFSVTNNEKKEEEEMGEKIKQPVDLDKNLSNFQAKDKNCHHLLAKNDIDIRCFLKQLTHH